MCLFFSFGNQETCSFFFLNKKFLFFVYFKFLLFFEIYLSSLRADDGPSFKLIMSRGFHTGLPTIKKRKKKKKKKKLTNRIKKSGFCAFFLQFFLVIFGSNFGRCEKFSSEKIFLCFNFSSIRNGR